MSGASQVREAVYAVVRVDHDAPVGELRSRITVKEVVWDRALAEAEVERLNSLNAAKGVTYFWQATRLYPPGTSASSAANDAPAA